MYLTSILMPLICYDASEAQGYRRFWRWHPDALAHWYTHLEGDAWYKLFDQLLFWILFWGSALLPRVYLVDVI